MKTGVSSDSGLTGMKPENIPMTSGMILLMGTHGLAKSDWTIEWFCDNYQQVELMHPAQRANIPLARSEIAHKIQQVP